MHALYPRLAPLCLSMALLPVLGHAQSASAGQRQVKNPPPIRILRPTIVAFFPVTQAEVDKDSEDSGGLNEALGDFDFYVSEVEKQMNAAGISIVVVNERSFLVRVDGKIRVFLNPRQRAGYYFIQPGKPPHVVFDVMTDSDLIDEAGKYFGRKIP